MANGNFGGGNGTKGSPFLVEDTEDFINGIQKQPSGSYFKQVNDLIFNNRSIDKKIKNNNTGVFDYHYDGNNFALLALRSNTSLFGDLVQASIRNLNVVSVDFNSNGKISAIAERVEYSLVDNVIMKSGKVGGYNTTEASGMFFTVNYSDIQRCAITGITVMAIDKITGLVQGGWGITIKNSYCDFTAKTPSNKIVDIKGIKINSGDIENCYAAIRTSDIKTLFTYVPIEGGVIV